MFDVFFEPEEIEVEPGQPVRFLNRGQVDHNAITLDGSWQTDVNIGSGEDDAVVIDEPGTYRNYVVVDAEHVREMGIIVTADGVAIENLTVRDNDENVV